MKKLSKKIKKNYLFFIIGVFAVIVGIFFVNKIIKGNSEDKIKKTVVPEVIKKLAGSDKVEVTNFKEVSGVYAFDLLINGQKYQSFISKDGRWLFPGGQKVDEIMGNALGSTTQAKKLTCNDLDKAEKAELTAYVVADCPYGLQMQRLFKQIISEQPELIPYLTVRYIGSVDGGKITSMHGDKEAQENLKQICVREEQKDKYWTYLGCYMQEGKSQECSTTAGLDVSALDQCVSDSNRGLKYAQTDFNLAGKFNVSGSPTLVLNQKQTVSEFDFGGRIPNSIKNIVCCGSKNKPAFCSQDLSSSEVAVSFSKSDDPSTTETTNANSGCGN